MLSWWRDCESTLRLYGSSSGEGASVPSLQGTDAQGAWTVENWHETCQGTVDSAGLIEAVEIGLLGPKVLDDIVEWLGVDQGSLQQASYRQTARLSLSLNHELSEDVLVGESFLLPLKDSIAAAFTAQSISMVGDDVVV
eukprot:SAG31_NODE_15266_length_763_cov_1.106928_2_plen_138_part_01